MHRVFDTHSGNKMPRRQNRPFAWHADVSVQCLRIDGILKGAKVIGAESPIHDQASGTDKAYRSRGRATQKLRIFN